MPVIRHGNSVESLLGFCSSSGNLFVKRGGFLLRNTVRYSKFDKMIPIAPRKTMVATRLSGSR